MLLAYLRTFQRMGLTAIPMKAETGPIGGDLSHEFQILAPTGESEVFYDAAFERDRLQRRRTSSRTTLKALYAAADEKHDPAACPRAGGPPAHRPRHRGRPHLLFRHQIFAARWALKVTGPDGSEVPVEMGSYGIGVSRLVGAMIEASHDEKGIIWPESVAPFRVGLVNMRPDDAATNALAEDLYGRLHALGVEVLIDDRDERAGVKFAAMDLIGLPWQVIVGPRGVAAERSS